MMEGLSDDINEKLAELSKMLQNVNDLFCNESESMKMFFSSFKLY